MKKTVGIVLLVLGLALGYFGYDKYKESSNSFKFFNKELSLKDNDGRTESYMLMGFGLLSFLAGVYLLSRKK